MNTLESSGIYSFQDIDDRVKPFFSNGRYDQDQIPQFMKGVQLPFENLHRIHQVHGTSIHIVDSEKPATTGKTVPDADGVFSSVPGVSLMILTADCVPVFFWDATLPVVGVVHAGWRGLKWGILYRAIQAYREYYKGDVQNLSVALGPSIRRCCYIVGSEFEEYFPSVYIKSQKEEGKGSVELQKIVTDQLLDQGLSEAQIYDVGICTSCQSDQFHSYRAAKTDKRNLSVISLKG